MNRRIVLCSVVFLLCVGCAGRVRPLDPRRAAFSPPEFVPPAPVEERLSGGVPVVLLEDHDLPLVRIYLRFRGGGLYDPEGLAGLAQVAELAWRTGGTTMRSPEALDEALEERAIHLSVSLGRGSGEVVLSSLSWDLVSALDLLEELLWRPACGEERVAWARSQVQEQLRREEDDPQSLAFREFRRAMYAGHPRGVIATIDSVDAVTREEVLELHRRLLTESSWVVGAVGDFSPEILLAELDRRFGQLPAKGQGFPVLPVPQPPPPALVLVPKDLPQATVVWGRLGPSRVHPEFYALDLVDHVVGGGGFQSRLVREIRSNLGLAYSVGSFYQALPRFGVLGATAQTNAAAVVQVRNAIAAILEQVVREGPTTEELAVAQDAMANRYVFRYQDPGSRVLERLTLELEGLPADLPARYLPEMAAVTPAAAHEAARWFGQEAGVAVVVGPLTAADLYRPDGPPVTVRGVE